MPGKKKEETMAEDLAVTPDFEKGIAERFTHMEGILKDLDAKIEVNAKVSATTMKKEIEDNFQAWKKTIEDETRSKLHIAMKALERIVIESLESVLKSPSMGKDVEIKKPETKKGIAVEEIIDDIFDELRKRNEHLVAEIEDRVRTNLNASECHVPEEGIAKLIKDVRTCVEKDVGNRAVVLNSLMERYKKNADVDMPNLDKTIKLLAEKEQAIRNKNEEFTQVHRILNLQSELLSRIFDMNRDVVLNALKRMGIAKDDLQAMMRV